MEKFKGYLQLVLIIGFVGFSIVLSRFIGRPQETIDTNRGDEATFFVEVETFDKRPYQIRFNTTGVVQAQSTVQIVPQVSGRVTYVHPNFYTAGRFEAGETLFEIESIDYELEVKRLESDVARAKTALRMEEVEGMASLAEWYQENGDEPAPDLVAREPQLEEAKANLQAAEANLVAAEIRLERTRFTLPEKGRVLRSAIEVGQFLQAGASYGEIYYNGSLEVSASIDDSEQFWLSQSSSPEVEISKSHLGKRTTLPGKLDRGAASLDAATRLGTVYFAFDAVPDDLVPGVFVEVAVNGPLMEEVSVVPAGALQMDGNLWCVDPDNRLVGYRPDIIRRTAESIVVGNLPHGSNLVISRLNGAAQGSVASVLGSSASSVVASNVEREGK